MGTNKKIIIVTGFLAAGKTAFSLRLSEALNIPCLNKDIVKGVIGREVVMHDREESKLFSRVTFDLMMHFAESLMRCGYAVIIEGNFGTGTNRDEIIKLIEKYHYVPLTYLFTGDMRILHERFVKRDETDERDNANKIGGLLDDYEDFAAAVKPLGEFNVGGRILRVDGSDFSRIDYDGIIHEAAAFLAEQRCNNL